MKLRQANKIRKASVAYCGGNPHRHRKPTIIKAIRACVWRGWRWSHDFGCMVRYATGRKLGIGGYGDDTRR